MVGESKTKAPQIHIAFCSSKGFFQRTYKQTKPPITTQIRRAWVPTKSLTNGNKAPLKDQVFPYTTKDENKEAPAEENGNQLIMARRKTPNNLIVVGFRIAGNNKKGKSFIKPPTHRKTNDGFPFICARMANIMNNIPNGSKCPEPAVSTIDNGCNAYNQAALKGCLRYRKISASTQTISESARAIASLNGQME